MSSFSLLIGFLVCISQLALIAQERPGENQAANELIREVVKTELSKREQDHTHWRYRLETETADGKELIEVIETKQGGLTRLIAGNGRPT
jgi:hypothetical protein